MYKDNTRTLVVGGHDDSLYLNVEQVKTRFGTPLNDSKKRVRFFFKDRHVDELITVLLYYRQSKIDAGKWRNDDWA